ncbi:MAG: hypothetical protein HDR14_13170 [Lachnospiraceae bacterium]|nr:hypothetical protein [Lachnospiraceae bacterium]
MSYDEEAVLLTQTGVEKDKDGFPKDIYTKTAVFVGKKSVSRAEAYKAMNAGREIAAVLGMMTMEYEGAFQTVEGAEIAPSCIEYRGKTYRIVRTYGEEKEEMELMLEAADDGGF